MSNVPLDSEELEAIQSAIRETRTPPKDGAIPPDLVGPLALIVDDRQAETARPSGRRIAERWARHASKSLRQLVSGAEVTITVSSADVIDGQPTRDELNGMWFATATPADGRGSALIAIGGPMIETVAAKLCGDNGEEVDEDRPPSPTARRIFEPMGAALSDGLATAWREEQDCLVRVSRSGGAIEKTRRQLQDSDVVISIALEISGALRGTLRLLSRPATFVPLPTPTEAVPASQAEIESALGRVPVEVRVDLGSARLTMVELRELKVGGIVTLTSFIDDTLPIRCADVIKAYGRPVVNRGVLSVAVDRLERKGHDINTAGGQG